MDSGQDITRIVRSWLGTDEHESADRVLGLVIAQLDTTRQRRSWWPARRTADMPTYAKLAIAAVSVIVVTLIGINLWPRASGPGAGSTASPAPSATPSPSVPASPSAAAALVFPPAGPLEVGRHSMTLAGVPLSIRTPTRGWTSNGSWGIDRVEGMAPKGAGFILWSETPVGVFANPCANRKAPAIGSSSSDLANAVAAVPGTRLVSGPTDVKVGGYAAKKVVISIPEDIGCAPESFYLWYAPTEENARYASQPGSTITTWIIDAGGTLVWIDGETYKGAGPEQTQALQQIVDSIQFE